MAPTTARPGTYSTSSPFFQIKVNHFDLGKRFLLSRSELCEPGLVFWLVEELLDSQTIDGCRVVFDYLDSRREYLTAVSLQFRTLFSQY